MKKNKIMKNIFNLFLSGTVIFSLFACKMEEPVFVDDSGEKGITKVSAKFSEGPFVEDPNAVFATTDIDPKVEEILIPIPYFYPKDSDNPVTANDIRRMKISLSVQKGAKVIPSIGLLDLNMDNNIEVIMPSGDRLDYVIKAQVYKLTECELKSFSLTDEEGELYDCVVNNENHTVTAFALTNVLKQCAMKFEVSPHASISSPDISAPKDWKPGDKLTVLAHDGVTKQEYTFSVSLAEKAEYGIRKGSEVNKWMKHYADYGLTLKKPVTRLAVLGKYLIVSTGTNLFLVNRKTGEKVRDIELPSGMSVQSIAHDDAGNVILAANTPHNKIMTVYMIDEAILQATPFAPVELFKTKAHANISGAQAGNLRVRGDVKNNAVITGSTGPVKPSYYLAWEIKGGKPANVNGDMAIGVFGKVPGPNQVWHPQATAAIAVGNSFAEGMFYIGYDGIRNMFYTPTIMKNAPWTQIVDTKNNGNENCNNIAAVTFNKAKYVAYLAGAHFNYSASPIVRMYDYSNINDVQNNLVITLEKPENIGAFKGVGASSDIAMYVSPDGYKMYIYYTDGNYDVISCYEFDCIKK